MNNFTEVSDSVFHLAEDPRVKGWFLIDSPATVGSLLAAYLLFVTKFGPAWMKNRKEFQLKEFMMFYNVLQIVYCGALVLLSIVPFSQFSPSCARLSFSEEHMILPKLSYAFFLLKVIDLLDTIIFVLRKKENQISFLHTFHHVYAVTLGYMNTRYLAGTQIPLLTLLNSMVHVLMYYYYMRTSLSRKSVWWKKYLTSFQLLQLGVLISCMIPSLLRPSCDFPKLPIFLIMLVPTSVLFSEFSRFYSKSYKKAQEEAQPKKLD